MNDKKRKEVVEELFNAAMAQYQSVEPRWGLEERILASLRERARERRFKWNQLAPVLAVAMTIVVLSQVILRPASHDLAAPLEAHKEAAIDNGMISAEISIPRATISARKSPPAAKAVVRKLVKFEKLNVPLVSKPATEKDVRIDDLRVSDLRMSEIAISGGGED